MLRIQKFGVIQTAKVAAVLYLIITAIMVVPMGIFTFLIGTTNDETGTAESMFGGVFLIFAPIIYAVVGFIFVAISCLIYNLVSKWVGGIEIEIDDQYLIAQIANTGTGSITNKSCPSCNHLVSEATRYCSHCGYTLNEMPAYSCSRCGKAIEVNWRTCAHCGMKLDT